MTLFHRRLLYLFFMILFFIIAPFIVLYALGYRYDFKKRVLEQTGVLYLETKPKGVSVYLNNVLQKNVSPLRFSDLLANDYEVRVTKDGYNTWQKTVTIFPHQTTFVYDINLFKKDIAPQLIQSGKKINNILASPDHKKIIALISDQENNMQLNLALFDVNAKEIKNLGSIPFSNATSTLIWSLDSKRATLAFATESLFLINTDEKKITPLTSLDKKLLNARWSENVFSYLNFLDNGQLYQVNTKDNSKEKLLNNKIADYLYLGQDLYCLEKLNSQVLLKKTNPPFFNEFKILDSLPLSDNYQLSIVDLEKKIIAAHDQINELLYILDLTNEQSASQEVLAQAKKFELFNKNKILYANDFEIWTYDLLKKEKKLVTRSGKGIDTTTWYSTGHHVICSTKGEIKIIETESFSQNQTTKLTDFENVNFLLPDTKGEFLFISGSYQGQNGLWQLEIQ